MHLPLERKRFWWKERWVREGKTSGRRVILQGSAVGRRALDNRTIVRPGANSSSNAP